MKLVSVVLILSVLISSCAHNLPQAKHYTEVDSKTEGEFFGKINIEFDGKEYAENNCSLKFVDTDSSAFNVNINNEGKFKSKAKKGKIYLKEIICKKDTYAFKDNELVFTNHSDNNLTFIGNIDIKWKQSQINPLVAIVGILVGWIAISSSGEQLFLDVKDERTREVASVKKAFTFS